MQVAWEGASRRQGLSSHLLCLCAIITHTTSARSDVVSERDPGSLGSSTDSYPPFPTRLQDTHYPSSLGPPSQAPCFPHPVDTLLQTLVILMIISRQLTTNQLDLGLCGRWISSIHRENHFVFYTQRINEQTATSAASSGGGGVLGVVRCTAKSKACSIQSICSLLAEPRPSRDLFLMLCRAILPATEIRERQSLILVGPCWGKHLKI